MDTAAKAVPAELLLACTLGPDDGAARLRRWQLLAQKSPPRAQRSGHRLEVRWLLQAGVKDELEALAAAERRCCSFVSWSVSSDGPDMVLYVTADENRPDDVAAVADLFGVG
jgi:MerR family transcriptional regulator, copper efflux regulator